MAKSKALAVEKLKNGLLPGEELLWHGKPRDFRLLEEDAKKGILGRWISGVVLVILTMYFCVQTGKGFGEVWLLPAILLVITLSPFVERRNLLRYQYWITNKRAILMSSDGTFHTMEQEEIDDCRIVRGQTSGDCLILGSQIFEESLKQMRWQACHPRIQNLNDGGRGPNLGMVFYALDDADEAAQYLLCRKQG